MRFAYLSRDEVNRHWAAVFARQFEVELQPMLRLTDLLAGAADGLICDLDSLSALERQRCLRVLQRLRLARPVMVHSYNLAAEQQRALAQRGIRVTCRLEPQLLARLAQQVRRTTASC